jgi:hypothetical protein
MCAESDFEIRGVKYQVYGGDFGANFSKTVTDIDGNFSIIDYYARYNKLTYERKSKDKRKFATFKKELDKYTKAELIKGFYNMLENFEENY